MFQKLFILVFCIGQFACSKDSEKVNQSDCDKGSLVIFEKPVSFEMNRSTNSMKDTCFYWELVGAYVIKLEIDNPNQNKPLGNINFKNPFIVNINLGAISPTVGEYEIEKPFVDPNKLVTSGKASMIVDGNIAHGGKLSYNVCGNNLYIKYSDIYFISSSNDTIYTLSGQLICKN